MRTLLKAVLLQLPLAVLCGCASFHCNQTDSFIDDEGNVLHVEYGELSREYEYRMVSPANGAVTSGKSTRFVRVELPSLEWIDCRVCQCPFPYGTMYETSDAKWRYFTTGLECAVYLVNEDKSDYLLVFKGTAFQDERSGAGSTR